MTHAPVGATLHCGLWYVRRRELIVALVVFSAFQVVLGLA